MVMDRPMANAFTLTEVMVAMAASTVILGGLLVGATGMQRSLASTEAYLDHYGAQRRLVDYIARDLRRATWVTMIEPGGFSRAVAGKVVTLDGGVELEICLPGFYQSDRRGAAEFDRPLQARNFAGTPEYGTEAGPANDVIVRFRRSFSPKYGACIVRAEEAQEEVIVQRAEPTSVQLAFSADARQCDLLASFPLAGPGSTRMVIAHEQVTIRNRPSLRK